MMEYRLSNVFDETEATVTLNVQQPDDYADIQYAGDEDLVRRVRGWLSYETGAVGNLIGTCTTAIDLHAAMQAIAAGQFAPQLTQGAELIDGSIPREDLPEGAIG